jgi:RNAse (barnase) inhibitor barstar
LQILTIDGSRWRSREDLVAGILAVLDPPEWHGRNLDALFDSMYSADINGVRPPYELRVVGASMMPIELIRILGILRDDLLSEHRELEREIGEVRRVLISLEP